MDVIKISLLGIVAVLPAILLKNIKNEYAVLMSIAVMLIIFGFAVARIQVVVDTINRLLVGINIETRYVVIILKMLGITYVAEFSAAICRDAGFGAVASQIEIFAKISLLVTGIPIINALISMIGDTL
ncbi:MAG: SpoIIIAC/SpoIIIAD family protein [Butyrivibrio sp.]|nr:SpoIIIAC/SpoIIIAD family protein [Butyrivibrio sp.]